MGALHRFEQRLEQMVTGTFARVFRSAVQPMEIAAALQREVDNSAQILSRDRRIAPNDFTVDLSGTDYDRLSSYGQTLSSELASMLHEHAQQQHYLFTGPISLNFTRGEDLTTGRFRVRSKASAQVTPAPGHGGSHQGGEGLGEHSGMFLEINGVRHPLDAPGLVVGRGSNADVRIEDPGISRRHVEFRVPGGSEAALSVVDLGSTNGTTVDGHRVQRALLVDGAVVQIGSTRITVRITGPSRPPAGPSAYPRPYEPEGHQPGAYHAPPYEPQPYQPKPYEPQPYQPQPYQPPQADPQSRPTSDGAAPRTWSG